MDCKLAALVIALCMSLTLAENSCGSCGERSGDDTKGSSSSSSEETSNEGTSSNNPSGSTNEGTSSDNLRGYILTSNRVLKMNDTNTIQLRTYRVDAPGKVILTLKKKNNDTVLTQEEYDIYKDLDEIVHLNLQFFCPHVKNEDRYDLELQLNGTFETADRYTMYGVDDVSVSDVQKCMILIQTEKPFYKPGQTVKIRILAVDSNLRPCSDQTADCHVEDTQGTRIAQWAKVPLTNIRQFEMPLSEEPPLGRWRIVCKVGEQIKDLYIDVKEYVLPKYEVTITPPSYVLADADSIKVKICAKYTYGKGVQGIAIINSSLEQYAWSHDKQPVVTHEAKIDGCYEYTINVSLVDKESYYSYRRIQVSVSFKEDGTEIVRNATIYIDRTTSPLKIEFPSEHRESFKPGLFYSSQVKVSLPDDTPAKNEPCQICHIVTRERVLFEWQANRKVRNCKNFTTDENGIIYFYIPPQNTDATSMTIEAKSIRYANLKPRSPNRATLNQPQSSITVKPYYSPSGSFIQLQEEPAPIPCDTLKDITLLFTSKENANYQIFYEIVANGKVMNSSYLDVNFNVDDDVSGTFADRSKLVDDVKKTLVPSDSAIRTDSPDDSEDCSAAVRARYVPPIGAATIRVPVTPQMTKGFHVIVYYIRDDMEVVADSQKFEVQRCFANKVSIEFGDEVKQPGTTTSLIVRAAPHSLCGIKVIDKSVELMDSSDPVSIENIFNELRRFDPNNYYSRNHCNNKVRQPGLNEQKSAAGMIIWPPHPPPSWSSSRHVDAMEAFEISGLLVISDFLILTRQCSGEDYGVDIAFAKESQSNAAGFSLSTVSAMGGGAMPAPGAAARQPTTKSVVDVRTKFPEDWLFYLQALGEIGELIIKERLPHTITEWFGSALCLNDEQGLGLSNKTTIKGYQDFFLELALPYSVVRGEKFWITITVFNYLDKALAMNVVIEQNDGFVVTNGTLDRDYCILGGKGTTIRIQILANQLFTVNITVRAKNADSPDVCEGRETADVVAKDGIMKSFIVEPPGFKRQEVKSVLFTPKDGDFTTNLKFPKPNDLVEGSERCYILVSGDIMGPTIEHMDRLVVLPTGCGEQNIAKFAPIVYVLDYLIATNQLTTAIREQAVSYLNTGYQRMMTFKHSDGSYSAFGQSDSSGSIFLTALVVSSFAACDRHRPIDYDNLATSISWIVSKQRPDGCFEEVGTTYDRSLKGGLDGKNNTAALTAYILMSLLSAGFKNESVTDAAISCFQKDNSHVPYVLALYARTCAKAGRTDLYEDYKKSLYERRNETGDAIYFPNVNGSNSINIQTAAYAVLAILEAGGTVEQCLPIIRYLSSMRNSIGGFSSTLDTVLALEALSRFAVKISKDPVDMTVTTTGSDELTIHVQEESKLVVKKHKLTMPVELVVVAKGSGTALMQMDCRYNTYSPPHKNSFSISAVFTCFDNNCNHGNLECCASYLPEGRKSNMVLVQAMMISGFAADEESLNKLVTEKNTTLVQKYEIVNNNVVLYFDEFGNDRRCINFNIKKIFDVENCQPGICTITDYYEQENTASAQYTNEACRSGTAAGREE